MKTFSAHEWCAFLVLIILGILLIMGRDGALNTSFCSIAGLVFAKGAGSEVWSFVKKARVKGKLEVSAEGDKTKAEEKAPPG